MRWMWFGCGGKGVKTEMHFGGGGRKNIMQQRGAGGMTGESERSRSGAMSWMKMEDRMRKGRLR